MTTTPRTFALLLAGLTAVAPQLALAQTFKPFTAPGLFRVNLPSEPELQDETEGNYRSRQWLSETEDAVFAVSVDEVSGPEAPKPDGWFIGNARELVEGFGEGEDVRVRDVTHRGLTGKRLTAPGIEAVVFVQAGVRAVSLFVLHGGEAPGQTQAFFDSLELLGNPSLAKNTAPQPSDGTATGEAKAPSSGGGGLSKLFGGGRKTQSLEGFERLKPDAEFSVMMPYGTEKEEESKSPPAGTWAGNHGPVLYVVEYTTIPVDVLESEPASEFLSNRMNRRVNSAKGRLIDSSRTSLKGYPGREFTIEDADSLTDTRAYLVGTRLYMLSVFRRRGVEAPERDAFFRSLELHYLPPQVKAGRASTAIPVREQRPFALGVEGGWNGLTGLGGVATYYVIPQLAVDAGVGRGNSGLRGSARLRYLPLTDNFTPHLGAGVQYGLGLSSPVEREQIPHTPPGGEPIDREDLPPGTQWPTYDLGIGSQLRLQAVVGVDLVTDGGFNLVLNVGYSYPVGGNNFRYAGYTPTVEERKSDAFNYGGGYAASVQLGYAF